ncbi:putative serine/threonine protein kinase [Thermofilum pendens Hrk 5]|uniref:non-specific serine/threonine protein kinase n=2 Tax=Thermofilum pendens TaxID=2269 RepID=A1RX46_THEPD|nr:putative serine/threonine protein kinase [Thermofilum pendens Hrk 5]
MDPECAVQRAVELSMLGVHSLCLVGSVELGSLRVIGKGTTSLVVKGLARSGVVAVKIRRTDANRVSLLREARILESVKELGVGPRIRCASRNFLVWDFINGVDFAEWVEKVASREELETVLEKLLTKLFLLDQHGIVHAELSQPSNHILVDLERLEPVLVDFESASLDSQKSNLTQFMGFLVNKGNPLSEKLRKSLGLDDPLKIENLKKLLKAYKLSRDSESFREILDYFKASIIT